MKVVREWVSRHRETQLLNLTWLLLRIDAFYVTHTKSLS